MSEVLKNNLLNLSGILLCLIPIFLQTGPFLPDFSLCIISIVFISITLIEKDYKYYDNKFFLFFALFYIYLLINSLLSTNIKFSLENSFFYFRFIIFSLAVWHLINHNKKILTYFTIALFVAFIIAIIDGYYQYFFETNIIGLVPLHDFRMTLPFDEELILGGYVSRIFPLLLALIILQLESKLTYLLICLLLIFADVLVFMSGERTAVGLMLLSTLYIIVFISKYRLIRFITLIVSLIVIFSITIFIPEVKEKNIDRTITQLGLDSKSDKLNLISYQHESHFIGAWNMFKSKPLIGVGVNQFRNLCGKQEYNHDIQTCSTHPHNTYIQLLAETGIIGFLFLVSILLYFVKVSLAQLYSMMFKNKNLITDYQVCIIAAIMLTIWPILPTQNIFNNWINVIYFLPVGFYLHSIFENIEY